MSIRIWAPYARSPALLVGDRRVPLRADDRGWWALDAALPAGTDYLVDLGDGRGPVPDPRSRWQPQGIDGPSRAYHHDAFTWTDSDWRGVDLPRSVVYELHVGTFSDAGTYDDVVDRLDHLVSLGVDVVELLPANQFSGDRGWGYDGVLWWAPHHAYGGPDALKRLVDACHARGLGVLMDVVYNHFGPRGNHLARFGPWFTGRYSTPWGDALNYDGAGSDEVRAHVVDNALSWLRDYHCDGLRLDAVDAIVDSSAVHLLEELQLAVETLAADVGRPLWLVAESDLNDPRLLRPRELGGYALPAQWSDDFHHALHAALTGERDGYYGDFATLADLAKALEQVFVYDGRYSAYRGRRHGRPVGDLPRTAFLGYLQDHDQVGNRTGGERTSMLLSDGLLRVGAALVLTSPFVPMLWMGEEWGASTPWCYFTSHDDADLAAAVREGRRAEFAAFGWNPDQVPDPQDPHTFERSRLDWTEPMRDPHSGLLEWHRELIALRREHGLHAGPTTVTFDESDRWVVVQRGVVTIAANLAGTPQRLRVPGRLLLASAPDVATDGVTVTLTGESVAILAGDARLDGATPDRRVRGIECAASGARTTEG